MMLHQENGRNYSVGIIGVCLLYFIIQLFYVPYAALSVDDFFLAFHTYHFKSALPYRDFAPYKTVLGYYLLVIPMALSQGILTPLIHTKIVVATANTFFLLLTGMWLKKFFSSLSILTGLILVTATHFFLSYASEIRVDILAFWFCLMSVMWIFENKYKLAGSSLGIAFLISQKALWHILAVDIALATCILFSSLPTSSAKSPLSFYSQCKNIFLLNIFILLPVVIYVGIWSFYSSFHTVMRSMFYEAYLVSAIETYNRYRLAYWQICINNSPLFFLLWPLTYISLFIVPFNDKNVMRRFFLIIYATITSIMIMLYKQPFMYNMTVLVPAYFLLYTAFFSWLYQMYNQESWEFKAPHKFILIFVGLYVSTLLWVICKFSLPLAYTMICFFPLLLVRYVFATPTNYASLKNTSFTLLILITLFAGAFYPLTRFVGSLDEMNGHYQKYMMNLANILLQNGGEYLAGETLFYNRDQSVDGLKHIGVATLEYLYEPNEQWRDFMELDSLYSSSASIEQILASLKAAPIKFFVNNNRFVQIPEKIKTQLYSEYQHFWGSIYLYAPTIRPDQKTFFIKFQGKYKIESQKNIKLDGKTLAPRAFVYLNSGNHLSYATHSYRLRYIPENMPHPLNTQYQKDDWQKLLF